MDWTFFPRGFLIGLSVAAPVGPMAVICIRRTLAYGRAAGFVSGLGVATADGVYGAIAAFGLTSVSSLLIDAHVWIRLGGGIFLCWLGLRTLRAPAAEVAGTADRGGARHWSAFGSTLGLTLTNPMTILSFAAIFAGVGVVEGTAGIASAGTLVAGVFFGSCLWWLLVCGAIDLLRGWLVEGRLTMVNRISGAVILLFGLVAFLTVFR